MDFSFIEEMYMPLVMVLCLIVGYVLKIWIKDADNKFIPTILVLLGAAAACLSNMSISLQVIVSGAVSGLASIGLSRVFSEFISGKKNK